MGQVRKIKAGLVKISVNDFIGEDGNVFFDIEDGVMRLSDGTTPGGIPLSSGGAEGGASTFRQLLDTPSSFSGAASRFVKVNPQASALEFVDVSLFDGNYNNLSNLPTLFNPSSIISSLIPQTDVAIDLGTSAKKWRDLYLSGNTIYLGDAIIRNVGGTIDLPINAKVHGRKIATDISELDDASGVLDSLVGITSYNDLTDLPTIPTDISDLADSTNLLAGASGGGVTSYNDLTDLPVLFSGSYTELTNTPTIPTDISDLTDTNNVLASSGAGYSLPIATNSSLGGIKIGTGLSINGSGVVSVTAIGVTSYNDLTDTPDLTVYLLSTAAFSGSYTDLTNTPVIPTVPTTISAFTNDAGYLTSVGTISYNDLSNLPTLFSGAYADLTDKPTLFGGSYLDLTNLPTLFSGSYVDLTNKPAIPADISELTDTSGLLSAATFDGSFTSLSSIPTTLAGYGVEVEVSTAINAAVNNVLDGAPALLDTLNEIAAAVGDDPNFVTTINTAVALKANTSDLSVVATSNNYEDLTNLPVIPADVAELSDTLRSIVPNAEYESFAMAIMLG